MTYRYLKIFLEIQKVEYLELMTKISELEQNLSKLRKEDDKLSKANQRFIIE